MKTRKTYLDFLRILAIFMVVYVHTGTEAAQRYLVSSGDVSYWFSLAMNSLTQTCAPLFFMISGAVLLKKEETLKQVWKHRILRFFIVLMIFGLAEYGYFYYLNPEIGFSLKSFIYLAYSTTIIQQYWFLYAYLGFLMILPFVRMMARNMKEEHFLYLAAMMFVLEGLCPIIEYLWGNSRIAISIPLLTNVILYPLLGYYLEEIYDGKWKMQINLLAIAALFTNTVIGHMAVVSRGDAETLSGMTMLVAAAVFCNTKSFFERKQPGAKGQKAVCFIGTGSMCVFLLEPPLRDTFKVVYEALEPHITWFPAAVIWVLCACMAGVLIYHVLKLIPGFKQIL